MNNALLSSEADEQAAVFEWALYMKGAYPELELMYHTPNGGRRNKAEAANLKRQGVKPGVPDICLPVPRGEHHGLYIEMKYGENKPTTEQRQWLKELGNQGYQTAVCYNAQTAIEVILMYLKET